jgi:photoactive yellow protein
MPDQSPEKMYPFLQSNTPSAQEAGAPPNGHNGGAQQGGDGVTLRFDDDGVGERLHRASEADLNGASFGIIKVDDEGVVEFFNRYESELSGVQPSEAVGRNFFTQVAPCTNNRLFRGRFKKGMRRGELDETFTYTYTYKMRPTLVDVHLYRDQAGHNWIMVQKY